MARKDKAMGNLNYGRESADLYETREDWITEGLIEKLNLPRHSFVWEPACGTGKMARVLHKAYDVVYSSDLYNHGYGVSGIDFLDTLESGVEAIITNPPYSLAQEFIEQALLLMEPNQGIVCMLLRNEYDSAIGRKHLFADNPAFAAKYVLTARPWWFERREGDCSPRHNYAWQVWDWKHTGPPTIGYIHKPKEGKK